MVSTDAQLVDMLKEVKSKSTDTIILERCLFALVVSALLFGNDDSQLVHVLNRQMRTVPNMFVASLAASDFSTGIFFKHFIVLFGNSFKMAFWRCNVPISRLFIINFGINLGSHKGIDGGE